MTSEHSASISVGGDVRDSLLIAGSGHTVQIGSEASPSAADVDRLTQEYRAAVARDWGTLRISENDPDLPLTQVFVLLQAAPQPPPPPLKRQQGYPDLLPHPERLEHAGLPSDSSAPSPVPLEQALKEASHLVLLGEPGAGKSTTLQFIGLCFAHADEHWPKEKLNLEEARVPILLPLPELADAPASEKATILLNALVLEVCRRLQVCTPEQARTLLFRWTEGPGLAVLLDGLDEVAEERRGAARQAVLDFVRSSPGQKARLVVASRTAGYVPLGDPFREYTLKPFSGPREARDFLANWLGALRPEWDAAAKGDELLQALEARPALRRLDNPLQLRLCAEVYAETEKVAESRADLYERYLDALWRRAERRGMAKDRRAVLERAAGALAWHLHTGGEGGEPDTIAALRRANLAPDDEVARALLDGLRRRVGLIVRVGERWAFAHLTLREYLVAQRLREEWRRDRRRAGHFLCPRLHLPEWQEVLLLLVGGMEKEEAQDFIRWVERAGSRYELRLRRDLLLAIALCAERGDIALPLRALRGEDWWVRRAAAEALGAIGNPQAVQDLLGALRDEDRRVLWAAAEALAGLLLGLAGVLAVLLAVAEERLKGGRRSSLPHPIPRAGVPAGLSAGRGCRAGGLGGGAGAERVSPLCNLDASIW